MSWCRVAWSYTSREALAAILLLALALSPTPSEAQRSAIDIAHSAVTVRVFKSGLLSGLAHNHFIQAPISSGSVDAREKTVELAFSVAEMKVLDPDASDSERQEIEATMKGPKVLDAAQFPAISFVSTAVASSSSHHSQITGTLKLHGVSHSVTVPVVLQDGKYSGSVTLRQTNFGITPVKIAGGAVKVKDEIVIEFLIVPAPSARQSESHR